MEKHDWKLVQIMPADGWRVVFDNIGGDGSPLVGWGLDDDGVVLPLWADEGGTVYALGADNFATGWKIVHESVLLR